MKTMIMSNFLQYMYVEKWMIDNILQIKLKSGFGVMFTAQ